MSPSRISAPRLSAFTVIRSDTPGRARFVAACLLAGAATLAAPAGFAATASLTDGRAGAPSALRDLGASGPRDSRWIAAPAPYQGNLNDHEGRSAGSFEDGGRGRITGEVLADENGTATIVVRDLKDTKADGKLVVTLDGKATRIAVERGANGNTRTLTLRGLAARAWSDFKVLWAMGSKHSGKRDGFSVCRS